MIEVDCICGQIIPVKKIETTLHNEDYMPVEVSCECGAKYRVNLHMDILKEGNPLYQPEDEEFDNN